MKHRLALLMIFFLLCIMLFAGQLSASIYKYSDRDKKEHYTDSLENVSPEYRDTAVNIDEYLEKTAGFVIEPPRPKEPFHEKVKYRARDFVSYWEESVKNAWEKTWVPSVLVFAVSLVIFLFAGKIGKALGHKNLSSVIRIFMTTIIMVYLLHNYVTPITNDFIEMRKNIIEVKKKAEERNREMDRLIKEIVGKEGMATEK